MRNRAIRPIAALLCVIALTGIPAQAGPIVVRDVVQVMSSYQNAPDLRLRGVSQNSAVLASGVHATVRPTVDDSAKIESSDNLLGAPINSTSDSLLSGVTVSDPQQGGVDIIDEGDVEGTVCDCGEIALAGGGFPKWPLLFLAAIPFFFIHGCDDCETPTPTPTPSPTPPGVPEPASLLLFGTGLAAFGAGLRRRYAKSKLAAQIQATEAE
jgi:PEP-CTERM motif